jgi:hypothetical protein
MAILKNITLDSGLTVPSAYHKITKVNFSNFPDIKVSYLVVVFVNQQARIDLKSAVKEFTINSSDKNFFDFDIMDNENSNIVTKCYDHLKSLTDVNGNDYTVGVVDLE